MSATHLLSPPAGATPQRKRFTRSEVSSMAAIGLFEGQRYELIDGDLIDKMGQNPPHAYAIQLVAAWLVRLFGIERVRIQLPMEASLDDQKRSAPEPDIAVLQENKTEFTTRHPNGGELRLIIEVADSSSLFDLTTKARLYARAGVLEYWVLDIANHWLIAHRHFVDGEYRQVTRLGDQETVSLGSGVIVVHELIP